MDARDQCVLVLIKTLLLLLNESKFVFLPKQLTTSSLFLKPVKQDTTFSIDIENNGRSSSGIKYFLETISSKAE
jgi:hypothetical protein